MRGALHPFGSLCGFAPLRLCVIALLFLCALLFCAPAAMAQRQATKEYMGRQIAQTMHYTGAEWLTRDNREQEERCSLMLTNLGLKRGMSVCDMGCGNGFYTLQMAK